LFFWVFKHELEHYHFYQKEENRGKKNNLLKEVTRLILNPRMFYKLNKFEREHNKSYVKDFAILKENTEGYKMIQLITGEDVEAIVNEIRIIAGKVSEIDKTFGDEVEAIKKQLKEITSKIK